MADRVQFRPGRWLPPGTVYVGPDHGHQPWANPFRVGHPHPFTPEAGLVLDREHAVALYAGWLPTQPHLCEQAVIELAGRDLACWCPTAGPCHGDILLALANTRLPALTLQQPWAWAVTHAGKRVENRTWPPPAALIGHRLAVHAGRTWWPGWRDDQLLQDAWAAFAAQQGGLGPLAHGAPFCDSGAIVAVVTVRGSHPAADGCCAPWGEPGFVHPDRGRVQVHHWVLDDVQPLSSPLACPGRQMVWNPPPAVRAALIGALR